jgi:hypothetical protein
MNWSFRAKAEVQSAPRTWFGTLTLRPEAHATMLSRVRVRLAGQGIDFDALPFGEQFLERVKECSPEVTKYLKRVRKQSVVGFRYLLVVEHHKSGLPHFHLLVHERQLGTVRYAVLSSQWLLGFEKWNVVADLNQATYLCKYLSKATIARVRASAGYGHFNEMEMEGSLSLRGSLSRRERTEQKNPEGIDSKNRVKRLHQNDSSFDEVRDVYGVTQT